MSLSKKEENKSIVCKEEHLFHFKLESEKLYVKNLNYFGVSSDKINLIKEKFEEKNEERGKKYCSEDFFFLEIEFVIKLEKNQVLTSVWDEKSTATFIIAKGTPVFFNLSKEEEEEIFPIKLERVPIKISFFSGCLKDFFAVEEFRLSNPKCSVAKISGGAKIDNFLEEARIDIGYNLNAYVLFFFCFLSFFSLIYLLIYSVFPNFFYIVYSKIKNVVSKGKNKKV